MAHFFKGPGMDATGYDKGVNKQTLLRDRVAEIALWGGDIDGSPLRVLVNNSGIVSFEEQKAADKDVRVFRLKGLGPGYSMLEAKNRQGSVWAYMQVQVSSGVGSKMSPTERVAEAMRRSLPLLPQEAVAFVEALISPQSILIVTGTLTLWAGSHLFGVGEIVDIVLLVVGGLLLGKSILDLGEEIWQFATLTINGTTDRELDEAAQHFAKAVVVAGVDIITAIFLRRSLRDVRARVPQPRERGLLQVGPPPEVKPGQLFYRPKVSRPATLPKGTLGYCDWYGDVYVARAQSLTEQQVTLFHESVHSFFSPKFKYFRQLRARLKASAYWRSALLRYLEETLAEGFGQFRVRGLVHALKAVTFPIGPPPYGYVTLSQLAAEGNAIGSIMLGGLLFHVAVSSAPPSGLPPTTQ
ncbi:MAG TPA: hypothetical protein VK550_14310 [Polyangiaceae bacterium]|nr:hypothetical protein [Polyangiaceae bacterium]